MICSKYHSKKLTAEGQSFDSKKEYKRWAALRLLEQAGEISNLRRQVKYVLIPAQYGTSATGPRGGIKRGPLLEHECAYIADFVYEMDGHTVVEDVKGVRTKDYIRLKFKIIVSHAAVISYLIKRKLMLERHGIRILET